VTDTRSNALAIPIIALTVREHEAVPNEGQADSEKGGMTKTAAASPAPAGADTGKAGKPKKEREGVFVVRDGIATFRPVKVGIAGDEYFEVLDGLRPDEVIVAGTYQAIRDLKDGAKVKEAKAPDMKKEAKRS
jgi:HlyD family secretion protein